MRFWWTLSLLVLALAGLVVRLVLAAFDTPIPDGFVTDLPAGTEARADPFATMFVYLIVLFPVFLILDIREWLRWRSGTARRPRPGANEIGQAPPLLTRAKGALTRKAS